MRSHKLRRFLWLACLLVFIYALMRIAMPNDNSDKTNTLSAIESMDQVALTSRVAELKGREDTWKNAKVWAGSLAAFLAVLLGIFEYLENRVEGEKEVAQERLAGLIREASNLEIAQAMKQSSDADARAGTANERAANASREAASATVLAKKYEADIASSNAQAAEARSMAKGFEADIAKANQSAAEANATAEKERISRLQLELRLAPRTLTAQQSQQMTSALSAYRGVKIDIVVSSNVPEIERIAQAIVNALSRAGWEIGAFEISMGGAGNVQGILVGARNDSEQRMQRAAETLVLTLRSYGIDSGLWDFEQLVFPGSSTGNGNPRGAPLKLFVGNKP